MPRSTHGDFDQVVELSVFLFRDLAAASFRLPAKQIASEPGSDVTYTGSVRVDLRDVWFGDAGETFDPTTGKWSAVKQTAQWNAVVLAIDIEGEIQISSFTNFPLSDTPGARLLRVHVGAVVVAPLGVERVSVRGARDEMFPAEETLCAVVKLPTSTFFYNVQVDDGAVRNSPFVTWARDAIKTQKEQFGVDLGDPEVVVVQRIKDELHAAVVEELRDSLAETVDWTLDTPARLGLVTTTPEMGVRDIEIRTSFDSIRVFMQTTGPGGQSQFATRSQIRPAIIGSRPADSMVITVNGRALLEQLRRPLADTLGIDVSAFRTDEPCTVVGPVTASLGGGSYTLRFLQAGIDEASTLIVWLFLRGAGPLGPVDVEIELPIVLSATRAVRGTKQVVLLEQRPGAARYAASSASSGIANWLIEDGTEALVANALRGPWALAPQVLPLPQGMFTQPNDPGSVSLHQAGAPRNPCTWPGYRLIGVGATEGIISSPPSVKPGRFREHDLVLRLDMDPRGYPQNLVISCVTPDSSDAMRRIDGVGGTINRLGAGGPEDWAMPIDAAIDWVHSGRKLTLTDGTAVVLGRAPDDYPPANPEDRPLPFLRTATDTTTSNNLASQPSCTMTTTVLSPTFAHWEPVWPVGKTGEDIVNEGVELGPDCLVSAVVLELLDKSGSVLATSSFGGAPAAAGSGTMTAGASMVSDPRGSRSLAVRVQWWFDAYTIVGYRLRYTVAGMMCP
jgi:hypothetical protein